MAQLTWNQVQAPNMRDANMLMSDAMDRQGIGGAMIAKSLGNIGQDIQNRRDAEYYAQMNQYANDPLGMAQALQNGAINQNGVSQDALQRGREYLSSAASNWSNNINTAHTDMLNKQRVQYANQIKQYNEFLANGDLASAQRVRASVLANDPTVSSEVFDGNLSFARQHANAMLMNAATGRRGYITGRAKDIGDAIYNKMLYDAGGDPNTLREKLQNPYEVRKYYDAFGVTDPDVSFNDALMQVQIRTGLGATGYTPTAPNAPKADPVEAKGNPNSTGSTEQADDGLYADNIGKKKQQ